MLFVTETFEADLLVGVDGDEPAPAPVGVHTGCAQGRLRRAAALRGGLRSLWSSMTSARTVAA